MAYRVLEQGKFISMDKTIKEQDKIIKGLQTEIRIREEESRLLREVIEKQKEQLREILKMCEEVVK